MERLPVLVPDVEVSRNLRRHVLSVPGEPNDRAFTTLAHAVDAILAHGFDTFILHIGREDFLVRPPRLSILDDLRDDPPAPPPAVAES